MRILLVALGLFAGAAIAAFAIDARAQDAEKNFLEAEPFEAGVVPDDLMTLVIGTRFVRTSDPSSSPKRQFSDERVPLSAFNETDHCVDNGSLAVAQEYFTALGRMIGKSGYFYHIPPDDVARLVAKCETQHGAPTKALGVSGTKIIAFGKVVPTKHAPALEVRLR